MCLFCLPYLFQDRIKVKYVYQDKEIKRIKKFFKENPDVINKFPTEEAIVLKRLEVIDIARHNNKLYELVISENGFDINPVF